MNKCLNCKKETNNPKFCNSSCSAIFNNKKRNGCLSRYKTKKCHCSNCNREIEVNIRASEKTVKCDFCKNKCSYCKGQANFKLKNGKYCCTKSLSSCPAIKLKNSLGLKQAHIEGRVPGWDTLRKEYNVNCTWSKGLIAFYDHRIKCSYDRELLFTNGYTGNGPRKEILILERGHCCEICKLEMWLNKKITLELHHVDGNNKNNLKSNLQLLCPNCHSQTPNWCRRKTPGNSHKYDIQVYIDAIKSSKNMSQCLRKLNLVNKSNVTIQNIMLKYNLTFSK